MTGGDPRVVGSEDQSRALHTAWNETHDRLQHSDRRPSAMRAEERERLIRLGLWIMMGDLAELIPVTRDDDTIAVGGHGDHRFGFPSDLLILGDQRIVLEHDLEWLADGLCEHSIAWGKRLPECPLHPDSHPLTVTVTESEVHAACPTTGDVIRSADYR